MSPSPRPNRFRPWIIDHAPLASLTHAHELFLAYAMVVIGLALVLQEAQPGSVVSQVPEWLALGWAISILFGGTATLWGVTWHRPRAEWCGQLSIGYGCAFYSSAVATAVPYSQGLVIVLVFAGLSLVSFWRAFKITSQTYIQDRLAREHRVITRKVMAQRTKDLSE